MVAELDSLGYQVVETQSFTNEVSSALQKLKDKDTRVILGNFNEHWARKIFCEAYKYEFLILIICQIVFCVKWTDGLSLRDIRIS